MKKEEICVLIDTSKKATKAFYMLKQSGEKLYNNFLPRSSDHTHLFYSKGSGWVIGYPVNYDIITLKQLKKLLRKESTYVKVKDIADKFSTPKEFAVPIANEEEYLKVKEVAEKLGWVEHEYKYRDGDDIVIFKDGSFNSAINYTNNVLIIPFEKFTKQNPETVSIQIPANYAYQFEIALKHLRKAEEKHSVFPTDPKQQLPILIEEVGEIAKDINDGNCHKSEVADTLAVCLRMLA